MPSYGVLPGLPDNYTYEVIDVPSPASPKPLLNAQPLRIGQVGLTDMPMVGWIIIGILVVGVVGILALAITKK